LGLPWPVKGETDRALVLAHERYRDLLCACGCGQFRADCQNPDTAGRWQIVMDVSQTRQALGEFQREHGSDIPDGAMFGFRLLGDDEEPSDPLAGQEFDPDRAATEYAEHQRRFGLEE
jgi:hypothetical protein